MNLAAGAWRLVGRPQSAGVPMPADLDVPRIDFPDHEHRGSTLKQLGPPHDPGSKGAAHDWNVTRALLAQRSHDGDTWARSLDLHGPTRIWSELASSVPGDQAAVQALVAAALRAASTQAGIGKRTYRRERPFRQDPTIDVIGRTPRMGDSSYPSAHAARSFAAARVISRLDPSLAGVAYAMAREVAISRIYAGVHFASDVLAGARLGTAVGEAVLRRRDAIVGAAIGERQRAA